MLEEEKTQEPESSPADANAESSPAQSEEATSQQATEKPVPFDEHPRWKEVREAERKAQQEAAQAKAQAEYWRGLAEASRKPEPNQKSWEEMNETERFWAEVDRRAEAKADAKIKQKEEVFKTEINSLYNEYGKMAANEFLKAHPDVKKDSAELQQIVSFAQSRKVDLDEAYKVVMFDVVRQKDAQKAAEETKQKYQAKTQQKIAANVETKSIPQNSIMISKNNNSKNIEMDEFAATAKELGIEI